MRLQDGFTVNKEKTFGVLKFSSFRREKMKSNDDGTNPMRSDPCQALACKRTLSFRRSDAQRVNTYTFMGKRGLVGLERTVMSP